MASGVYSPTSDQSWGRGTEAPSHSPAPTSSKMAPKCQDHFPGTTIYGDCPLPWLHKASAMYCISKGFKGNIGNMFSISKLDIPQKHGLTMDDIWLTFPNRGWFIGVPSRRPWASFRTSHNLSNLPLQDTWRLEGKMLNEYIMIYK